VSGPFETIAGEPPMIPTVFEIEDLGALWMTPDDWLARGVTQDELLVAVFDGSEIPQVPLDGSAVYLALGLALLIRERRRA
jgi:hypothetical protein